MVIDKRCGMCDSGAEEDVEHLLVTWGGGGGGGGLRGMVGTGRGGEQNCRDWRAAGRIWKSVQGESG